MMIKGRWYIDEWFFERRGKESWWTKVGDGGGWQMLILQIKRKWFDMILAGEKKEEYRDIKPYYDRLLNAFGMIWVGDELIHAPMPELQKKQSAAGSVPERIPKRHTDNMDRVLTVCRIWSRRMGSSARKKILYFNDY